MVKMKTFKGILFLILNIILIASNILLASSACWYLIPGLQQLVTQTGGGEFFRTIFNGLNLNNQIVFWILIVSTIVSLTLFIVNFIIGRRLHPKYKNIFIHLNTWIIALFISAISIYTFVCIDPLSSNAITFSATKKATVGIVLAVIIVGHLIQGKLSTIINRKIQAYETAKEMNTISPLSTIYINILKMIELFCPEMLILVLLALLVSWNVACYFIIIILSCVIPMIGNMCCDFNRMRYTNLVKKIKEYKLTQELKGDNK